MKENYWSSMRLLKSEKKILDLLSEEKSDKKFLRRTLCALYVLNAACKIDRETGCLVSSIAFTHGVNILHELEIDYGTTEDKAIFEYAKIIGHKHRHEVSPYLAANLTLPELRQFAQNQDYIWAVTTDGPHKGHMIGIIRASENVYHVWDTHLLPILKRYNCYNAGPTEISSLHSRLKLHHSHRIENPLCLYGFRSK